MTGSTTSRAAQLDTPAAEPGSGVGTGLGLVMHDDADQVEVRMADDPAPGLPPDVACAPKATLTNGFARRVVMPAVVSAGQLVAKALKLLCRATERRVDLPGPEVVAMSRVGDV
jgi:hypothetical protein